MANQQIDQEMGGLQAEIVAAYCKSSAHRAAVLSMLCTTLGTLVGIMSSSEEGTLDGIDLAHRCIRQSAADAFVAKQKLKESVK